MGRLLLIPALMAALLSCRTAGEPLKEAGEQGKFKSFNAPKFVPNTMFEFERTDFGTPFGKLRLGVLGTIKQDIFEARTGRNWHFGDRIRFPLTPGKTWKYSRGINRPWCENHVNKFTAEVGNSLEKSTVNGLEFDVVRIVHKGTWRATCQSTDLEGDLRSEYLYSPKLGMFVSMSRKVWSVRGDLQVNIGWELIKIGMIKGRPGAERAIDCDFPDLGVAIRTTPSGCKVRGGTVKN